MQKLETDNVGPFAGKSKNAVNTVEKQQTRAESAYYAKIIGVFVLLELLDQVQ